jgi:hypothetical protein
MKTYALYGFIAALAGAFLTLAQYFLGWHSDIARLGMANWVGGLLSLATYIACITLGVRARRDEVPANEGFGYGRSLLGGLAVASISTGLGTVFAYCYNAFINPGFSDILLQDKMNKLEAGGMSGDQLEKTQGMMHMFFTPLAESIFYVIFGMIVGLVIALIVAAFVKRPAPAKAVPAQA